MKIKDKIVYVYDIEIFPNVFHCTVKNSETSQYYFFEISERKNNVDELIQFFTDNQNKLMCGYNNKHYDDPIINYILDYQRTILSHDYLRVCNSLFLLSDIIVNSNDTEKWKRWKYANLFESMDLLTMLFSQKLRVGLKEMQVTMQYKNVQEYEGDFTKHLPVDEIDKMIKYNINDVDSTEELLNKCKKQIDLRIGIEEEFGVNVLSKDGMTIGTEILKIKYLEKSGKSWYDIKDLRSPCDIIDLKDVIFPFVEFETPILQELLLEMKQQRVSPGRKGYEKHFLLDNVEISVGVGGIHSKNEPEIIIPKEDELLLDSDVNSLYPSLIISYNLVPKHLGKEFLDVYGKVREDRLYAKHNGLKVKNETYKLALNGATGNYQNQYSWLYDPIAVMKIRINGQLLLLMLTERLLKIGAHLKQLNTDGILYTIPKNVDYQSVLKEWEKLTKLTLETEEFEAFYQFAINDYLAIGKGYAQKKIEFANGKALNNKGEVYESLLQIENDYLKKKGLFIDKVSLGKGMQPMIIPKAINEYFANGVSIENTVKNCKDINDFITYQKVGKEFSVEYNNKLISRINRYYVSTVAPYLYKCKVDNNGKRYGFINLLTASGVKVVNNLEEIKEFPSDINYRYYITEAKKIINSFERIQLSLF